MKKITHTKAIFSEMYGEFFLNRMSFSRIIYEVADLRKEFESGLLSKNSFNDELDFYIEKLEKLNTEKANYFALKLKEAKQ